MSVINVEELMNTSVYIISLDNDFTIKELCKNYVIYQEERLLSKSSNKYKNLSWGERFSETFGVTPYHLMNYEFILDERFWEKYGDVWTEFNNTRWDEYLE